MKVSALFVKLIALPQTADVAFVDKDGRPLDVLAIVAATPEGEAASGLEQGVGLVPHVLIEE